MLNLFVLLNTLCFDLPQIKLWSFTKSMCSMGLQYGATPAVLRYTMTHAFYPYLLALVLLSVRDTICSVYTMFSAPVCDGKNIL